MQPTHQRVNNFTKNQIDSNSGELPFATTKQNQIPQYNIIKFTKTLTCSLSAFEFKEKRRYTMNNFMFKNKVVFLILLFLMGFMIIGGDNDSNVNNNDKTILDFYYSTFI